MSITSTCLAEIDGKPLPDDIAPLLVSAYVDDSQQLPDTFVLRFRDPHRLVVTKTGAKIGSAIKISVQVATGAEPEPLIFGEITALEAEYDSGGTFTVLRGYDQAHRLFRGRRTAAYQQMTASDIATTIAQRAGLEIGEVTSTRTVYDHLSQAGQTDWEILTGLARTANLEITVRQGKFSFAPPAVAGTAPTAQGVADPEPLALQMGRDLLRFRSVLTSAGQVDTVEVRGWDVATKQALTANQPATSTRVELPAATAEKLAKVFAAPPLVATDVPYRNQAEVDQAAAALADDQGSSFAEFEGTARGNPKLRAGTAISIDGLGEPFDGKYTITTSRHRFDPQTGYTTALSVTGRKDRTLFGLSSGGRVQAAPGPAIGQVSDVSDPENQGRVRLTLPWLSDDYVSGWARTVHLGAGKDRGFQVLPEVGDEVLVAFEQGCIDRPVVLGGLYNGIDTPPSGPIDVVDGGTGQIDRRSFVSRKGHRIDLVDASGGDGIRATTAGDKLTLIMDQSQTSITVKSDGTVTIEGSKGITIDAKQADIALKGNKIDLAATAGVNLNGGQGSVDVAATGPVSLKGMSVAIEGQTSTELKAGAVCTVQGAMVRIN